MQDYTTKTVRDIAVAAPATVRVFEEFKIDYCCGGRRSIDDACRAAGVDPAVVKLKLDDIFGDADVSPNAPERMNMSDLIDHIIDRYHVTLKRELPRLAALAEKVARRHGENHPELLNLETAFYKIYDDLIPHMQKEEMVLFPYVTGLQRAAATGAMPPFNCFGSVENPIRVMLNEHEAVGELLAEMRGLTDDYTLPEGACPSYSGLFYGLQELERELHAHIHLESNVLFPNAVEAERAFVNAGETETGLRP